MQNIINRIQIAFIDYAIFLLSESKLMRSLLAISGKYYQRYKEAIQMSSVLLICGLVGLITGRLLIRVGITFLYH